MIMLRYMNRTVAGSVLALSLALAACGPTTASAAGPEGVPSPTEFPPIAAPAALAAVNEVCSDMMSNLADQGVQFQDVQVQTPDGPMTRSGSASVFGFCADNGAKVLDGTYNPAAPLAGNTEFSQGAADAQKGAQGLANAGVISETDATTVALEAARAWLTFQGNKP